jgi:hypothetical protein
VLVRSKHRSGTVSVFDHPSTVVSAIAGAIDGQALYQGLTSDFTNLPRLLERLSKDGDKSYYTEVLLEQSCGTGLIYTGSGRTDAVFSTGEGETMLGEPALREMLSRANDIGATINVYRPSTEQHDIMFNESGPVTTPSAAPAKPAPEVKVAPPPPPPVKKAPEPEPAPVAASQPAPPPVVQAEPPKTAPPIEMAPAAAAPKNEAAAKPSAEPPPLATTHLPQSAARTQPLNPTFVPTVPQEPIAQPSPQKQTAPPKEEKEDIGPIVKMMEEVLQTAERTATGTIKDGGEFATALREGLLEVTDTYPFLDPFAGEFEYRKGQLKFRGKAKPAEFVTGTTTALRQALQTFARRFGDRSLPSRVQQHLRRLVESHGDEYHYHGLLNSIIDDLDR